MLPDPNIPLFRAARALDTQSDTGATYSAILAPLGLEPGHVQYLAEQRTLRVFSSPSPFLVGLSMDGLVIGWKARELSCTPPGPFETIYCPRCRAVAERTEGSGDSTPFYRCRACSSGPFTVAYSAPVGSFPLAAP